MDLTHLSDQLSEKLKETSALTRTIACRILERVREFKETFSGWPETVSSWTDAPVKQPGQKVYHRQPTKQARVKTVQRKSTSSKSKSAQPRKTSRAVRKAKK